MPDERNDEPSSVVGYIGCAFGIALIAGVVSGLLVLGALGQL